MEDLNESKEILIVEDSPTQAEKLKFILEMEDYQVSIARNGKEALSLLSKSRPTAVISDIVMPEMNGYELCRQIKANKDLSSIPVILLTVLSDPSDVVKALECGADNFLTKPYEERHLLSRLQYFLINHELRRTESISMGLEIFFHGQKLVINSDRLQILNLLLSTYEAAVQKNDELTKVQEELKRLNERLEEKVEERTADLKVEVIERKQVEDALRESEERYRSILEAIEEGYFEVDISSNFTFFNDSLCRMFGYTRDELMGMSNRQYMDKETAKKVYQVFNQLYTTGEPYKAFDWEIIRKDGTKRFHDSSVSLIRNAKGEKIGFRGIARDITDRKRVEEVLRTEREKLEMVTQNMGAGLAFISKDYQTLWANNVLKQIFGDAEGKACYSTYNKRAEICPKCGVREVFEKGSEKVVHEQVGEDIEGNTIWSEIIATPIKDKDGNITAALELVIPMTERKQAEEALKESERRYRSLFDGVPIGLYRTTVAGEIIDANPALVEMLGYLDWESLSKVNVADTYIGPEERKMWQPLMEQEGIVRNFQKQLQHRDGTVIWVEENARAVCDAEGRVLFYEGSFQDITDRKRAEEEMMNLQEQLRQSQKMEAIGHLAGGIAHDFNNLLTIIKGYSQLSLIELKEGDPLKENIEEVKKATDRAADLIRQLLVFSRRQVMEMSVLDLNILLQNLDKMLRRIIGEDIELVTLLAEDLGRVKTDPGQIEQVILNLAVNARDAMPSGGKLTIETANVELDETYARRHVAVTPGRYVMLAVSDTGVGMTPEVRDRVFEPFFTTKEKGKGTGLGLSTVYGIVKQSEGNIWIYSEPGHGTTFKIYLPQAEELLEEVKEKVVGEELPCGSETVLVVEDEEEVRKVAAQILRGQGYKVLEASNGADTLMICKEEKEPIDLILTDVVMPKMSGCELAKCVLSIRPEIKVLYMSGYTDNTIVHHGVLERGINYIQKPFTVGALAGKVREVLDNKEVSVKSPFAKGDSGGFDQG